MNHLRHVSGKNDVNSLVPASQMEEFAAFLLDITAELRVCGAGWTKQAFSIQPFSGIFHHFWTF